MQHSAFTFLSQTLINRSTLPPTINDYKNDIKENMTFRQYLSYQQKGEEDFEYTKFNVRKLGR